MNVTFDTNVVLRLLMADDPGQLDRAQDLLARAEVITLPVLALCEAIWTMRTHFHLSALEIADTIEAFTGDERVRCDRRLVDLGLVLLRSGGDFADAVIAGDGQRLGADSFATFDRKAARLLRGQGVAVTLLG